MPDGLERGGSSLLACCVDLQRLGGLTDALARLKNAAAAAKRRRHSVHQIELHKPLLCVVLVVTHGWRQWRRRGNIRRCTFALWQMAEHMRLDLMADPRSFAVAARRQLTHKWRQLLADQDAEQPDQRKDRGAWGAHLEQALNHTDQQAGAK